MKVKDLGEAGLIEQMISILGRAGGGGQSGVVRGIGDDAAVLQVTPGNRLIATCDLLIEGKHFDLRYSDPFDLGHKALAVNISDIAAMGGRPRWALVALGVPPDTDLELVQKLYYGIAQLAQEAGVAVVGGDTSSSGEGIIIDISLLGEAPRGAVAYRSAAVVGDFILVTGSLGASAGGLEWLKKHGKSPDHRPPEMEPLLSAHFKPAPRYREALIISESAQAGAMIDLSDGLAAGLLEIASSSGVGIQVEAGRIPILPEVKKVSSWFDKDPLEWALYGGEDYELLFTLAGDRGAPKTIRKISRSVTRTTGVPVTVIGRVTGSEEGVVIITNGENIKLEEVRCYNHFKS